MEIVPSVKSMLHLLVYFKYSAAGPHRLTTIDESASILSDISYDKTDDSLDWDSSHVRTVRLKKREKRVSKADRLVFSPPFHTLSSISITVTCAIMNICVFIC